MKDALLTCRAFAFNSQVPPALLCLHHASVFMLSGFLRLVDFYLPWYFPNKKPLQKAAKVMSARIRTGVSSNKA
jgi:hypothetical protein